jgi:hypothetical protein
MIRKIVELCGTTPGTGNLSNDDADDNDDDDDTNGASRYPCSL